MRDEANIVLRLNDVVSGYDGLDILKGISFDIKVGQLVTVVGPNGHGKTTLLKTISGLVKMRKGAIEVAGRPISDQPHEIAGLGVAHVPQGDLCFRR